MKYLHARGKIVLSDYREYAYFDLFRGRFSRAIRSMAVLIAILGALFLLVLGFAARKSMIVLAGGLVLLCLGSFFYLFKRQVKTVCVKNKPLLYASHEVRFGGNGLIYSIFYDEEHNPRKLEDSQMDYLYENFYRVYENGGFFFFYTDKKSAIIVPKRNMTSADFMQLRNVLRNALGKKFVRCI